MKKQQTILTIAFLFLSCFFVTKDTNIVDAKENNMSSPKTTYIDLVDKKDEIYKQIEGKKGDDLLEGLATILTNNHKYYTSYDDVRGAIAIADESLTDPTKIQVLYGGIDISNLWQPNNYSDTESWNREHVWCKSLSGGLYNIVSGNDRTAGADIHQLRPAVNVLNSARNNSKYANLNKQGQELIYKHKSGTIYTDNYYNNNLFEPRDEIKGDIARILMYMYTHYSNEVDNSTPNLNGNLKIENIIEADAPWKLLLHWNKLDPVDSFETKRNNYCMSITGVSNPYVDHPEFADMVFDVSYDGDGALIDDRYKYTIDVNNNMVVNLNVKSAKIEATTDNKLPIIYTSCNEDIASVTSEGYIYPHKEGKTKIILNAGVISNSITVNVADFNKEYKINYYANDGTDKILFTSNAKYNDTLKVPDSIPVRDGYTFKYWSASNIQGAIEYNFDLNLEREISLYAIWAKDETSSGGFILVKDINELQDGDKIIIACKDKEKAAGTFKTSSNSTYLTSVDATFDDNKIISENAEVFNISIKDDNYIFTSSDGQYLAATTARSFNTNGSNTWKIEIDSTGVATIDNTLTGCGSIQFNASSPRFLNYTSKQTPINIYRQETIKTYDFDVITAAGLKLNVSINQNKDILDYNNLSLYVDIINNNNDDIMYAYTDIDNISLLENGNIDNEKIICGNVNQKRIFIDNIDKGICISYYIANDDKIIMSSIKKIMINNLIKIYLDDKSLLDMHGFDDKTIKEIYNILNNYIQN